MFLIQLFCILSLVVDTCFHCSLDAAHTCLLWSLDTVHACCRWSIDSCRACAISLLVDAVHSSIHWSLTQFALRLSCTVFYAMILLALVPQTGEFLAIFLAHSLIITGAYFVRPLHGVDCRTATLVASSATTAWLLSPLHALMVFVFATFCPACLLWWPPKKADLYNELYQAVLALVFFPKRSKLPDKRSENS